MLDLGEGLGLVEAEADLKPSGSSPKGRVADDPLDTVEVYHVLRNPLVEFPAFAGGRLPADKLSVVGITGEIRAVAIRDGQRSSRWKVSLSNVVSKPIQAEGGDNNAAHVTIVVEKG